MPLLEHTVLIPTTGTETLWRYMSLDKFKFLLEERALFFCRANKFADPFEGSIPRKVYEDRIRVARWHAEQAGQPFDEVQAIDNAEGMAIIHRRLASAVVVNCWNINDNESDAMWQLYLKSNEGVAIQTSTSRLLSVLNDSPTEMYISKVRYIDYEREGWYHPINYPHMQYNMNIPLIHKRNEFKHENELRIFSQISEAEKSDDYWDRQRFRVGITVPIDVNVLIEKVILPPTIDTEGTRVIKEMSQSLGYDFNFEVSALNNKPLF